MPTYGGGMEIFMCNAGLYLRLSKENGETQSESILNQKTFLIEYAKQNGFNVVEIFADDGYTGTNFNRPGFIKMMNSIKQNKINTVITKDLSRLGRDYIETGNYIEKIFPQFGVRYIAVNDGIDTLKDDDFGPFRSVINDMYSKDISKKVRCALNTKRQKGDFVGSIPPYGYMRSPENKNQLIVDNSVSENIIMIYNLYIEGYSLNTIAKKLTQMNIKTPSEYKNLSKKSTKWNDITIKNILTNPVYIGDMIQHKTEKLSYKLTNRIKIPECSQTKVKNTHERIISEKMFKKVQKLLQKK